MPFLFQAFTDESFLLKPKLTSLSVHPIRIIDSWIEVKQPVRLDISGSSNTAATSKKKTRQPSQLANAAMYQNSFGVEIYPLIVQKSDLLSALDVQVSKHKDDEPFVSQ